MCATHHGEGGETGTVWRRRRTPRRRRRRYDAFIKRIIMVYGRERGRERDTIGIYLYVTVDRRGKKSFYLSFLGDLYRSARERDFLSPIFGVTRTFDVSLFVYPDPPCATSLPCLSVVNARILPSPYSKHPKKRYMCHAVRESTSQYSSHIK